MEIIRAAGGIVWLPASGVLRLALVHRPDKDDWSLPKGKLEPGERWEDAALREVREETGCLAHLAAFAGSTFYFSRRGPKLVLYWHMVFVADGPLPDRSEVDEVAWVAPEAAQRKVHRERDRVLIARAAADARASNGVARSGGYRRVIERVGDEPDDGALVRTKVEVRSGERLE